MRRIQAALAAHPLALLLGVYLALGLVYSSTIPLFEAPDEQWHFAYVQHVAKGLGLPIQSQQPAHLARQEGSQPPLYYLLAAAATAWIDSSNFPAIVWENPHYGYNLPGIIDDNKNLFVHTSEESFPYRGAALAVHVARLVSLLFGALAIFFTYRLLEQIFPGRRFIAFSGAALVAFVPQFLLVSAAVSNDSSIVAMSALSLWLLARWFRHDPGPLDVAAAGGAAGLAALAKVSGLGLIVLAIVLLLTLEWRRWKRLARNLAVLLGTFALLAAWWYVRNLLLYGELTGTSMMLRIFGVRQTPLTLSQFMTQAGEVWETFWIGFGWGNIRADPIIYSLLGAVVLFSALGLLLGAWQQRGHWRDSWQRARPFGLLFVWAAMVGAELIQWMMMTQAPHGRLLFPALPAILPLLLFGLLQWWPQRLQPAAAGAAAASLGLLAALAPILILSRAYAYPPAALEDDPAIQHRVELNYDNRIKLLGYSVSRASVAPDHAIQLDLYWQSLAEMDRDYTIGIHLLDSSQHVIGSRDSYPGHGMLPTRLWRPGQVLRDTYWVPLEGEGSGAGQIQVAIYDEVDKTDLPAFDPTSQAVTPFIGRFKIPSAAMAIERAQNEVRYIFGAQIAFEGYDLSAGSPVQLTLHWKRTAPVRVDYTVFVHVLDANGKIIAQEDQQPQEGNNPTSSWEENEQVLDPYSLSIPADGSARTIEIGLYRPDTGERLAVTDGQGRPTGDHVTIPMLGK